MTTNLTDAPDYLECYDNHEFSLSFTFKRLDGTDAPFDGIPTVYSNNGSLLSVELSPSGNIFGTPHADGEVTFGVKGMAEKLAGGGYEPVSKEWTLQILPRRRDRIMGHRFATRAKRITYVDVAGGTDGYIDGVRVGQWPSRELAAAAMRQDPRYLAEPIKAPLPNGHTHPYPDIMPARDASPAEAERVRRQTAERDAAVGGVAETDEQRRARLASLPGSTPLTDDERRATAKETQVEAARRSLGGKQAPPPAV